jgi:hypothetical protein
MCKFQVLKILAVQSTKKNETESTLDKEIEGILSTVAGQTSSRTLLE